ncbi:Histone transcription regulator 3, partial [Spiromyces aspiralis]
MRYMTAQLCQLDKRNWHHKPKYLLAWLDFHVFGDFESAKGELYSLIQMRSTTKQLASFYKTEFESPGKHYLYLEKYIRLLVLVLRNLKDRDDLQVLYKKVAKGEASLFNSHELSMLIKDTLEELLEPATEAKSGQEEVAPLVADDSSGARLS